MKEINPSRILRWIIASFIVSFSIALIFNVGIASAETGTISVSEIFTSGTYTFTLVDGNPRTYTFSTLLFDNTNYNHVSSFTIYITNSAFFLLESNYTTFTIVSGGTGSGYITYSKTGGYIDYNFNSGTTITGSQIGLSLDLNIFDANNMNAATGSTTFTGQAQSSTKPICIRTSINQCLFNGAGVSGAVSYASIVSKTLTNGYEVTYPQPNKYLVNITKWGAIGTEIKIHNQTAQQFTETSFNLINFTSPLLNYGTGIYINVTTSTGAFTDVLINSSGVAPAPTSTPPGGGGSSSGQIYFDYTNATPGAVYGVNATITTANFSSFDTYYIDVFDPTGIEIMGFPVSFGTQNYSTGRFYYFNTFGTYTANLSYCSYLTPIVCPSIIHPTLLDTASLTVNPVALTYNITTDKANYQSGDNIYINATNPGLTKAYITVTNNGGIVTDIAWNSEVAPNSVKNITAIISNNLPLGRYLVSLADNPTYHVVSQVMFNITAIPSTPNTLGLGWAFPPINGLYFVGNTGVLTYTSNMNASTVSIYSQGANQNLVLEKSFVASAPNTTGNYSQVFNKPGIWYANIVDNNNATNFLWSNTTVNDANPTDPDGQKLCKSKENYVCWDKHEYTQGDAYIINYKLVVPSIITYYPVIKIYDPSDTVVKTVKLNYSIWNNTITGAISGKFSTSAKIGIWFVKAEKINQITAEDNGEIANSATSVIGRNETTAAQTVPSGSSAASSFGNNLLTFLAMPAFWGLSIFVGTIFWVSRRRGASGDLGIVAFILANLEAVIGLWSPFTWYILIVSWVIAGIYFTVGRKAVTQN